MPTAITDLLRGKPEPVTATPGANIKDVLAEMINHNYSQLPVVDDEGKPIGLITSDSIVRALHNFGVKTEELSVKDAMLKKPATYYPNDDVFDLLDDLKTDEVILIIDAQGKLIGIITTYDTTTYLRRRSEDIMVVREIEEMVKEYIKASFKDTVGNVDQQQINKSVEEITPSNAADKNKFRRAIQHYLTQQGSATPQIDQAALDAAFTTHLYYKPPARPFDRLTLGEYVNLLLHDNRWKTYSPVFGLDRGAVRRLLDRVRDTRNALAHFRDEFITEKEREELRFCKEWLARHEKAVNLAFGITNGTGVTRNPSSVNTNEQPVPVTGDDAAPIGTPTDSTTSSHGTREGGQSSADIPATPKDSMSRPTADPAVLGGELAPEPIDLTTTTATGRYAPLVRRLIAQPASVDKLSLTFDEIDALLGEHQLPDSARKYRAWWANDTVSHAHSQQWLEAGWRVANINMSEQRVVFARITDNEQSFLTFFTALQEELERAAPGEFRMASSGGRYWLTVDYLRAGNKTVATFNCSFTRTKRFRIELYLDTYDQRTTKQLFDGLYGRKEQIESQVGEKLSWERLDENRPSRIARYYPGSITDTTGALTNLRARAVEAAQRFVPVLRQHLTEIIPDVLGSSASEPVPETIQ